MVTKKGEGIGKELSTSADNYIISIKPEFVDSEVTRLLLLSAGLAARQHGQCQREYPNYSTHRSPRLSFFL